MTIYSKSNPVSLILLFTMTAAAREITNHSCMSITGDWGTRFVAMAEPMEEMMEADSTQPDVEPAEPSKKPTNPLLRPGSMGI